MSNELKTGVYCIRHKASGKRYVGSAAKSFAVRWRSHRIALNNGKHTNRYLQRAWNKYGDSAFEFHIVAVTLPCDAVASEQAWIDFYKSADGKHGYNIAPIAGSCMGVTHTMKMRKANSERGKIQFSTPEARKASSERAKIAQNNPEVRKANSERAKLQFGTPEARKASSERAKIAQNRPDVRKANSERQRLIHGTPEARKAAAERTNRSHSTPEFRKTASERTKRHFLDPEARKANSERQKICQGTPEARKANSERQKIAQNKPETIAKRAATIAAKRLRTASTRLMIISD